VWHGVLLVFGAPCQFPLLAGPEHGRTIPLAVIRWSKIPQCSEPPDLIHANSLCCRGFPG
jgi:hypothetical protein